MMISLSEAKALTIHKEGIMGARIEIAGPDKGMYLVISNAVFPETLVQGNQGEIVIKLSAGTFLATLPFHGYMQLKKHPDIRKIGPITVNIEKFNKSIEMLTRNSVNA